MTPPLENVKSSSITYKEKIHQNQLLSFYYVFSEPEEMRQLKGKPKENAKEKKERKKEFSENREKAFSIGDVSFHSF